MRLVPERGVPPEQHKIGLGTLTDWDAARVFLEAVGCGAFRSAADHLELSINAVRRRIDDFERQIGANLFTRDVHGTRLTNEGTLVVSAVERMEAASFDRLRAGNSVADTLRVRYGFPLPRGSGGRRSDRRRGSLRKLVSQPVEAGPFGHENQRLQRQLRGSPRVPEPVFPTYACVPGRKIVPLDIE